MNNFINGAGLQIFDLGGKALLIVLFAVLFMVAYRQFFKLKNKKINLAAFLVVGVIASYLIANAIGHNMTPPCLEAEYDTRGSTCVEYGDSDSPTLQEQEEASGKMFASLITALTIVVVLNRKEE